jgi:hypothetical protein
MADPGEVNVMFEQSILQKKSNPWAIIVSFGVQSMILIVMILIPLLNYYDIPVTTLSTFCRPPRPCRRRLRRSKSNG